MAVTGHAQEFISIYPEGAIPNSKKSSLVEKWMVDSATGSVVVSNVTVPKVQVFLAPAGKATGTAVVICPGGAYMKLGMNHSGSDFAKALNEYGISAFVLKYRLPDDRIMPDKTLGPFQDLNQTMQLVKEHARQWKIDTTKIGVAGFSAGGHLASSIGTSLREINTGRGSFRSVRPAFMILVYPVISFIDSLSNKASRQNLLGGNPSVQQIRRFSNELHVDSATPPAFIVHAADDRSVPVESSIEFYKTLLQHKVAAELHIYPRGGHAFGLDNKTTPDKWFDRCINWMKSNGWL